jgi:hypothetical protein
MVDIKGYRVSSWVDIDSLKEKFGLKVLVDGKWLNVAEGGKGIFFDTKALAKEKIATMKKDA